VVVTVFFSVSVTVWVIVPWAFMCVLVNVSVLVTILVTVKAGCVIVISDIDGVQDDDLDVGHCSSVLGFVGVTVVVKLFVDQAPDAIVLIMVVRVVGVQELPCNFIVNDVVVVVIDSVVMLVLAVLWPVGIHELPCDVVVELEQLQYPAAMTNGWLLVGMPVMSTPCMIYSDPRVNVEGLGVQEKLKAPRFCAVSRRYLVSVDLGAVSVRAWQILPIVAT